MAESDSWAKKYEPRSLNEMVLHRNVRDKLENILRNPKDAILFGSTGVGKGTFTNILLKETSVVNLHINASDETGIDVIREKVKVFAQAPSPKSFFDTNTSNSSGRSDEFKHLKIVTINEAEGMSIKAQQSLRELMEKVENVCKFIFMTNNIIKIDDAIQSRCTLVEIKQTPIQDIFVFVENMLNMEGVRYENGIPATYVSKYYPDIRKIIKEIQANCVNNQLQSNNINPIDDSINMVLINLRLHLAYYNISRKKIYDELNSQINLPITIDQFYQLLRNNSTDKVSEIKKTEFINIIMEKISVKEWFNEYLRITE